MAEKGSKGEAPVSGENGEDTGRSYIVVPMPAFLRQRFIEEAKVADKPTGPYVRDLLANALGITLPPQTIARRSKYASPEEAKAAQKAKAQERNALVKQLIAEHRTRLAQSSGAPAETDTA